jgi:hypothetical protein
MNTKFTDIVSALTTSLDRYGAGTMMAPFKAQDGSTANPSITFGNDQGTGLYSGGANVLRAAAGGSILQEWNLTQISCNRPLVVTTPVANTNAFTATGNGTGQGGVFQGGVGGANLPGSRGITTTGGTGSGSGNGGLGVYATGGAASGGAGSVQGRAIDADGGLAGIAAPLDPAGSVRPNRYFFTTSTIPTASGVSYPLNGLTFTNAAGINVIALDAYARTTATVAGWQMVRLGLRYDVDNVIGAGGMLEFGTTGFSMAAGSAATSSNPAPALTLTNANLAFASTVVAPAGTTVVTNTITPANICKVWAVFGVLGTSVGQTPDVATTGSLYDTFNVASVTATQLGVVTITFAAPFASAAYKATITFEKIGDNIGLQLTPKIIGRTASTLIFRCTSTNSGGTTTDYSFSDTVNRIGFHVDLQGRQ